MSVEDSIVFIIDDDPAIREAISSLLRSMAHTVRAFATTQEFLLNDLPDTPCCLVLDVRLPGKSGLEFQRELSQSGHPPPIIFISGHSDIPMTVSAMKAGAIEFLAKPFRDQDLLDAVHRGIELDASRRKASATMNRLQSRYNSLTPREREVMALVVQGQMNKQIASELHLSEVTVKVHRAQVMNKMRAKSLPDLVRFADRLTADIPKS